MARFVLGGRIAVAFLTTEPVDTAAVTQAELTGGVDLVGSAQAEALVEISGFEPQTSSIPTPDYSTTLVGNVAGDQTYPDSALSFYKDDTDETIYSALPTGTTGWVAIMQDGLGTGEEIELFPCTVASRVRRPGRNVANIFDVNLAIDVPVQGDQAA